MPNGIADEGRSESQDASGWNHWAHCQEEADRELSRQFEDYRKWNDERVDKLRIFVAKASALVGAALLLAPLIWAVIKRLMKAP